jgi:MFS family permease
MPVRTRWSAVIAVVTAGVIAALQIGKAAIALPVLQTELSLSLFAAAWIVGAYSALGALAGLPGGILVSMFDARRTLLAGLMLAGAASMAGAFAPSGTLLIATRVLEGCGFLACAISGPRLLRALVAQKDSEAAFAFWAMYLPTGAATMMLAGPALLSFGWQTLWIANGTIALLYAGVLSRLDIHEEPTPAASAEQVISNVRGVLSSPGPVLLAVTFCIYTFQYSALTGLMPTLLVQQLGLSIGTAGLISALTVVANAFGNLSAGALARMGVPIWAVIAAAFAFLGFAGFGIFSQALPVVVIAILASASLALTGMIPGSIFGAAPKLAPTSAMLAIAIGLINQTSNIGNLIGPAALGAFVQAFGWTYAPAVFVGVMIAGVTVALLLRRVLRRKAPA